MNRHEFSRKMLEFAERTPKAAEEYARIADRYELKTQEDIDKLKREWLLKIDDFRVIQSEMKDVFSQAGLEEEAELINESYAKYVGYIEEKSMKFSVATMNSGELDIIQKLENEESKKFSRLIKELADRLYN